LSSHVERIRKMPAKVCLISPPKRAYNHHRPPLALMYLAAALEKNGISASIIDPVSVSDVSGQRKVEVVDEILKSIERERPQIAGISCFTPEFNDAIALAGQIKALDSGIKIVIGGVHATLRPKEFFFEGSPVDFAVIGEGEETFPELCRALMDGSREFEKIKGIAFMEEKKGFLATDARPLIHDLDSLALPAYDKIDMAWYTAPNPYAVRGLFLSSFYILVGRGCPSECTFCVSAELRKTVAPGKALRCRSAKNVVDEIALLKDRYGIDSFYFIDDNFTLRRDLVSDICDELKARGLNLLWSCSARINTLNEEILKKMKAAGCVQVDLGVESGSDAVLKRLKKGINTRQIKEVFRACKRIGMRTFANILVNVPGETEAEVEETLNLLDEIRPSVTSFNIFIPYLGTEIYGSSGLKIRPDEYWLLGEPPLKLVKESRFRFSSHKMDFADFYARNHRKYNSIFTFLPDYLSPGYLTRLARSRKRREYFLGIKDLAMEYMKQVR